MYIYLCQIYIHACIYINNMRAVALLSTYRGLGSYTGLTLYL